MDSIIFPVFLNKNIYTQQIFGAVNARNLRNGPTNINLIYSKNFKRKTAQYLRNSQTQIHKNSSHNLSHKMEENLFQNFEGWLGGEHQKIK